MKNDHFADRNCRAVRRLTTPFRAAVVVALAMASFTCKDASGPSATSLVRVDISPDSAIVFAGDFVQLTAVARNSAGAVISGKTFTWTILDPSVAAVSTSGRVTGMRLGRTRAIASSDGRADTAIVNVKVITSTTLSPQLDTLRSLNDSLQLAAQSFADAIQRTGQYTWQSSDATVATVSSTGVVVARMNGTVWIKATEAGGTLDSARIVVQQRLAQILVAPGSATRPLGRTQQFTAQAVDARGNAVAGSVLIWSSRNPSIASVDATGFATGLAVGVATIEAVSGGVSGTAQLTVAPPPALIFSFTTTEVGVEQDADIVGGSSLGISTSAPTEATLTVSVSNNAPGTATTSTGMTIAQGQSAAPLSVRGLTQGTARLIASAPGYVPDTADVVVSTPRLMVQRLGDPSTTMTFSQTRQFQALLADSSGNRHNTMVSVPITVTSSNSAVLTVSTPSLTIEPGASASAAVTISPQGVGTAKVRITAPGYFDDSSLVFTVVAPQLGFDFSRAVIGLRQQSGAGAGNVILPETRPSSVVVTFTQKHPEFVQFPVQVTVPANSTTAAIGSWSGIGLGEDTVIATAFGFAPETLFVRVSTPQLTGDALPASIFFTQPAMPLRAYAADTLGNTHFALDTVAVRVTSSDPAVLSPDSAYIHILKGSVSSTLAGIRVVGVGTASITLSDSAGPYLPYTTNVVTVSPAPLSFSQGRDPGQPVTVGMRQRRGINVLYVSVAEPVSGAPLTIALGNDNPTAANVPASVAIPVSGTAVSFDVTGLDTVGIANIVASAFGHAPDTMTVQVGVPGFRVETMTSAYTTSPPAGIYVITIDQSGGPRIPVENVTATLTTSNAGVLSPDSASVTILAGQTVNSAARAIYSGAGTATLTASDARLAFYRYASGTSFPITVILPPLSLDFTSRKLGVGQSFSATVQIPSNTVNPGTTVTVTHSNGAVTGTPAAVPIAAGQFSAQFQVDGLALGVDTIVVNATGYLPDTAVVLVEPDRVIILGLPATLSISRDTLGVRLQVLDPDGVPRNVSSATTFSVFTSSHLAVNGRAGTSTAITVPAGSSISPAFTLTGRAVGTGLVQVTHSQFATVARNVSVTP